MKKRQILLLLLFSLVFSAAAGALQPLPDSAQYGKVLFCDDFESCADGADIVTGGNAPTFVSDAFTAAFGGVRYASAGHVHYVQTVDGNKMLKIAKKDASQRWPQIALNLSELLAEGAYTLSYTVTLPADSGGVSSTSVRFNFKKADGSSGLADTGTTLSPGETETHTVTRTIGGAGSGSDYAYITSFLVFCTCDATTDGSYILIDDLVLYGKTDKVVYTLPDGSRVYDFYAAGDTLTLANARRFAASVPDGMTAVCLRKDGVDYGFGAAYQTAEDETTAAFDVIVAEKTYTVYFDPDTRAATLPEVTVTDGAAVTLPALDEDGFLGWSVPDMAIMNEGDTFVFDFSVLRDNIDSDGRLVVKAVYGDGGTLSAPSLPADLPSGSGEATVGELLAAACAVRDSVYGGSHAFVSADEMISYAVDAGLLDGSGSANEAATIADAVRVLANTLPARFYPTLTGDAFAGGVSDLLRPYADKLFRAGILEKTADLSATLTKDALGAYLEKLCDRSRRSVTPTRTVYVFGDSLCDPTYNSWIEKLRACLDGNINVVNYAVGGYNTAHFVHSGSGGYARYTEMLSKVKKGDYVFVALGTNDATLWKWNDHPELSVGGQKKTYEASRDDFQIYTADARAAGAVPVYIVPISRNVDMMTDDPYYLLYDNRIVTCMEDANAFYGEYTPVVNFKTVSDPLINEQMTVEERAAFYKDSVHYTDSGAALAAGLFRDIVLADGNAELAALRTHLSTGFDLSADTTAEKTYLRFGATQNGVAITNVSAKAKTLCAVFAVKNADGRLLSSRVFAERLLAVGETMTFTIFRDNGVFPTLDPAFGHDPTPFGTLYVFESGLSPAAEPVNVYSVSADTFIETDGLFS